MFQKLQQTYSKQLDSEYLTLYAYYSCQSEDKKTDWIVDHIREKMESENFQCEDDEIGRTIAEQTLSLVFDIASTRMLKSLVEMKYMNELYS